MTNSEFIKRFKGKKIDGRIYEVTDTKTNNKLIFKFKPNEIEDLNHMDNIPIDHICSSYIRNKITKRFDSYDEPELSNFEEWYEE